MSPCSSKKRALLRALMHPNIVQTNEIGSEGRRNFLVMEFLDGRSLHCVLRKVARAGGLPLGGHLRVLAEALHGVHHAHLLRDFDDRPLGIIHRDVSPPNIFVTFDGQAKVMDFGIAKAIDSSLETRMGVLKGRVAYMAPEQALGRAIDHRADVYSVGVMIWEAAAGRRLWPGMADIEILSRLLREGPPSLRSVCSDASEELHAICHRAMSLDPDHRYSSAAELLTDLEAHLGVRGDSMTMREVGALVAAVFADERQRMNSVVEEAVVQARKGRKALPIPRLNLDSSTSSDGPSLRNTKPSAQPFFTAERQAFNVVPEVTPLALGPSSARDPKLASDRNSLLPVDATYPIGAPGHRRYASTVLAAVAALVGGFLIMAISPHGSTANVQRDPSATALASVGRQDSGRDLVASPPQVPQQEVVGVEVHATPSSALIAIDGTAVLGNPFFALYPKDAKNHDIVVYASGFDPQHRTVTFGGDVVINFHLEPRLASRAPSSVQPASVPAKAASSAPAAPPPPRARQALHPIQFANPYGEP